MLGTMMNFPLTLAPILERAGKLFSKVEVVSRLPGLGLGRCKYGDIYRRARQLAHALQLAGLKPGDRVATLMWNHAQHVEAYFGIPVAGGILHTLNLRLHANELAYIVTHARDRYLIVDDVLLPVYESSNVCWSFPMATYPFPTIAKTMKISWPARLVISYIPTWTKTKPLQCALLPAQRGNPRASCIPTVPWYCTVSTSARLIVSVFRRTMSRCPGLPCSMQTHGGFRLRQRWSERKWCCPARIWIRKACLT